MGEGLLTWLLPDVSPPELERLRKVITALRLLRDDARRQEGRVASPWPLAAVELERLVRDRRRRAIESLLEAELVAHSSADSFLDLGAAQADSLEALRELLESPSPALPAAGLSMRERVEHWISAGRDAGASERWVDYWRARVRHVFGPPAAAERGWRRAFLRARGEAAGAALLARLLSGWVAARLERYQPLAACALCSGEEVLARRDAGLRRLFGWSALLSGQAALARELLDSGEAPSVPRPIAEFRESHPEWSALLAGPVRLARGAAQEGHAPSLRSLGAELLIIVGGGPHAPRVVRMEATTGVRAAVQRNVRAGRLLPSEARLSSRAYRGKPGFDCLGGERVVAVARVALPGCRLGEAWLQVECAHALLPSRAQLEALARTLSAPRPAGERPEAVAARAAASALAQGFLAGLDVPREVRATWLQPGEGGLESMAESGPAPASTTSGPRGIVARAANGEPARHAGEPQEVLWTEASAGVALPLLARGGRRVLAVLVLESRRKEVLDRISVEAVARRLSEHERCWWWAAVRDEHRRQVGRELHIDDRARWWTCAEERALAAPEGQRVFLVTGPRGSGRCTLARALAFRLAGVHGQSSRGHILRLDGLEPARLLRSVEEAADSSRLWLIATRRRGELERALERLGRPPGDPVEIVVPPLSERRAEIPGLVRGLVEEAQRRQRLRTSIPDESLALLFRQRWPGNVGEVRALVEDLLVGAPLEIGASCVRAALEARGHPPCESLGAASVDEIAAAMAVTRHRNGNANLARAARYLGLAAETLSARLRQGGRAAGVSGAGS